MDSRKNKTASFVPAHIIVKARPVDLTGKRFHMLVAQSVVGQHCSRSLIWRCVCDCGAERDVSSSRLVGAKTKSCGCENARSKAQLLRFSRTPAWNKGASYQIRADDQVYGSKKAWTNAVIKKYGNRCQRCGWNAARCDAHHKIPRNKGGVNTIDNAEVLCPNCHRIHHYAV